MFNITNFKTNIADNGVLPTNKFDVVVTPPPVLRNKSINYLGTPTNVNLIAQQMRFRCDGIKIPGIDLILAQNARYGIGPEQKYAINAAFGDNQISIISDGYGDIYQFWYNWVRAIFPFAGVEGASVGSANRQSSYTMAYKDDYVTTISITVYDAFGNGILRFNMNDAFPFAIDATQLNWSDNNNLMRLNVGITYKDFTILGTTIESASTAARTSSQVDQSVIID